MELYIQIKQYSMKWDIIITLFPIHTFKTLISLFHCKNVTLLHKNKYHLPSSERTDSNKDMNQDSKKLS